MFTNLGVECPECGAPRNTVLGASQDSEGHRIRIRECVNCAVQFTTLEVAIPFSFSGADALKRERHGTRAPARASKDFFEVSHVAGDPRRANAGAHWTIRLRKGQRSNMCRKGQHELVGANVYVNPTNGQRACNPCRRESSKARYHHAMQNMPASIRAERNIRNRDYLRMRSALGLRSRRREAAA